MEKKLTIGITGGIGSGKSYICQIIETMGYPVFYSDQEAKSILNFDSEVKSEIQTLFGNSAYLNGVLDRKYIATQIFEDPSKREQINSLVHPKVRQRFTEFSRSNESRLVFNEAAILFETGAYKNFDRTILVTAEEATRIKRIQKRDGLSIAEIQKRIKAQWPDSKKIKLADFVIQNNDHDMLLPQLESILQKLLT